jgi:magnesium-transporting ATPase (P-type)
VLIFFCRTELPATEDLSQLSPKAILQRGKFLTMGLMMAILDPPREEAITAIAQAHKAGIVVKMITGKASSWCAAGPA